MSQKPIKWTRAQHLKAVEILRLGNTMIEALLKRPDKPEWGLCGVISASVFRVIRGDRKYKYGLDKRCYDWRVVLNRELYNIAPEFGGMQDEDKSWPYFWSQGDPRRIAAFHFILRFHERKAGLLNGLPTSWTKKKA
jgi:hypothetical protein